MEHTNIPSITSITHGTNITKMPEQASMNLVVEPPSIAVDIPHGWDVDETSDCWLVLHPSEEPESQRFKANVAIVVVRAPGHLTINDIGEQTIAELRKDYTGVNVSAETFGEDMLDRCLTFTAGPIELVQFQRFFLVPALTDRVNWLVQIQATASADQERAFMAVFADILSSVQIAPPSSSATKRLARDQK